MQRSCSCAIATGDITRATAVVLAVRAARRLAQSGDLSQLDEPVRRAVVQTQVKGWKTSDDFRFKTGVRKFGDWPWLMVAGMHW